MKALTICQPYAHLICLPDSDDRAKRVENRRWSTAHRGKLLIHAGKSRSYLSGDNYGVPVSDMVFGAIIGVADLCDCIQLDRGQFVPPAALERWPWLAEHQHVEGPFCFVLANCRRFEKPIPYSGCQGLFSVSQGIVQDQLLAASTGL